MVYMGSILGVRTAWKLVFHLNDTSELIPSEELNKTILIYFFKNYNF